MHKRKFHDSNNYPSSDIIDITNDSMDFTEDSADEVPGLINESWEALDESDVDDILIDSENMDQLGFPSDIKQESSEDVDGHHCDNNILQCEQCSKTFSMINALTLHIKSTHDDLGISCYFCKKTFANLHSYKKNHKNCKNFGISCLFCKKT